MIKGMIGVAIGLVTYIVVTQLVAAIFTPTIGTSNAAPTVAISW